MYRPKKNWRDIVPDQHKNWCGVFAADQQPRSLLGIDAELIDYMAESEEGYGGMTWGKWVTLYTDYGELDLLHIYIEEIDDGREDESVSENHEAVGSGSTEERREGTGQK